MSDKNSVMTVSGSVNKLQSATVFIPDSQFPVIDPKNVAAQINLLQEAKALGEKNLPPTNQASRFGTREMDIDTEIQRVVSGYQERAIARVEALDAVELKAIGDTKEEITQTRLLPNLFKQEVQSYLNNASTEYEETRADFQTTQKEYETFRRENGLERTCNFPGRGRTILSLALLALFILVEGCANSSLFATNLEGGWLDGFIYAILASAINVGIAFFLGFRGVRYINHNKKQWIGFASLTICALLVLFIGFVVAHYRDALQIPVEELLPGQTAASVALQTFSENPFALSDIYSWLLLLLTLFFGVSACLDGYWFDDPYPGYSAVAKKYLAATDIWAEVIEDRRIEVNSIKEKFLELFKEHILSVQNGLVHAKKTFHSKQLTLTAYQDAHRSADKAFQTLVSKFRSENTKYRTEPPPQYFGQKEVLDLDASPNVPTTDFTQALDELAKMVDDLRNDSEKIRGEIIQAFDKEDAKLLEEKKVIYA